MFFFIPGSVATVMEPTEQPSQATVPAAEYLCSCWRSGAPGGRLACLAVARPLLHPTLGRELRVIRREKIHAITELVDVCSGGGRFSRRSFEVGCQVLGTAS